MASGNPSGMATIKITTAIMAILPIFKSVSFENNPCWPLNSAKIRRKTNCEAKLINVASIAYFPIY